MKACSHASQWHTLHSYNPGIIMYYCNTCAVMDECCIIHMAWGPVNKFRSSYVRYLHMCIGACRPGPTRALPGLIMFLVVLVLSKLGFTIAEIKESEQ